MLRERLFLNFCLLLASPALLADQISPDWTFEQLTRLQAMGTYRETNDQSSLNRGNVLAQLAHREFMFEARPDLSAKFASLEFMLKPRLQYKVMDIETNSTGQRETESEFFLNEGRARWRPNDRTFLSYGREVLLWGPAMLMSTSNPFSPDNGRGSPYTELDGREYVQLGYLADWATLSLIVNTGEGRDVDPLGQEFSRTYALKLDWVGSSASGAILFSHSEQRPDQIGGFLQGTLSKAWLLYAEIGLSHGSAALYPQRASSPAGWDFATDQSDHIEDESLVGISYTFESGLNLVVEYLHQSAGYTANQNRDYYSMADDLAASLGGPATSQAASLLAMASNPGLPLLRQNYLFVQLQQNNIMEQLDLTLRYTSSLDDAAARVTAAAEWAIGNSTRLFALGVSNSGQRDTEFRRYFLRQITIGINVTF